MHIIALFLPVFLALIAGAVRDRPQCGDISDIADTNSTCKSTAMPSRFQPIYLNTTKWIWTGENLIPFGDNPIGTRGFRKNITSPCGKCATCAEIITGVDNVETVWVNGKAIGSSAMWSVGSVFFTALKPSWNLFVISGVNLGGPAAVYAAIRIHYSDGSSEIFTTDESWKTLRGNPPATFTQVSFDDSLWPTAILEATWDSLVASWGRPTLPPILPLTNSKWIWTSDNLQTNAPAGSRGFRRSVTDCTKRAVCATAVIAADNLYTFYVNGQLIGSGSLYYAADAWSIPNLDPIFNTFSVNGTNTLPGPAGLIATILITYSDGTNTTITTDASWKAIKSIPDDFAEKFLDDGDWEQATVVGNYGIAPWNVATIPPA